MEQPRRYSAVVLAGGRAQRLGGVRKSSLVLDGVSLLDRSLRAVSGASHIVVVGDVVPTNMEVQVRFTREEPAYGGPVAGLFAGLAALPILEEAAVVVAVDMPQVTADTVARLLAGLPGADASVLGTDHAHLAAALWTRPLLAARPEEPDGYAWRRLLARLQTRKIPVAGEEDHDVDTWADLPSGQPCDGPRFRRIWVGEPPRLD